MNFFLDEKQKEKLAKWAAEQDQIMYEKQINGDDKIIADMAKQFGCAYYGAVGGALTYQFTPTSIGEVVHVFHQGTKNKIDLTDYDSF